jgi:hypothetical protein
MKGLLGTSIAGAVLALVLGIVTRYAPLLTGHFFLSFAWGFMFTWVLFAVVYRCSGMTGWPCILMVLCWMAVVVGARQFGRYLHESAAAPGEALLREFMTPRMMVFSNPAAWIGIGAMTFLCRDGDDCIHEIADLAMSSPLSGRRR